MDKMRERLLERLEYMDTAELVAVHNRYCEECQYMDDVIYPMAELEERVSDLAPMTLIQMIHCGNFNPNDDYFWYNGEGNLESSDFPEYGGNQRIYTSDIVSAMMIHDTGFGDDECQSIIDGEDEDEEEDEE